jgi:multiple sugar transport system ATP-binding protein
MAHIRLDRITKQFGATTAVRDLTLDIADGEFFVLLGPTGAGKTTTLRLIAGLDKPTAGRVLIDEQDVVDWTAAERDIALVFQYYSLYPRYTVRQNLEFPLKSKVRHTSADEIARRIAVAAKTLRIEHLLDRKTDKLSGGEMQRVAIGRAIVREPRAFLMDEPLSNLDAKLREALRSELKDLQMKLKSTFLFVTHDQIEAMTMGDKIGVLNQGRIVQVGTPYEIYNHPRDVFVAGFVGSPAMNLIKGELDGGVVTTLSGRLKMGLSGEAAVEAGRTRGAVTVGIRAEDIVVGPGGSAEAKVHHVENHGVELIVTLRVDDHLFKATVPATQAVAVEETVPFAFAADKVHFFDGTTGVSLLLRDKAAA